MATTFINIGFHNFIAANRIISVVPLKTAISKRMVSEAKRNGLIIDMTHGRKTRTLIVMDNKYIALSAIASENLEGRVVDPRNSQISKINPAGEMSRG